jgi:hypothetical protein
LYPSASIRGPALYAEIFPLRQRSIKAQELGRFQDDREKDQPARAHQE